MSYQSAIGKVKGLGSSKHGFGHWWMQRMSAVLLVPCGLYVLFALSSLQSLQAESIELWVQSPLNAGVLLLFTLTAIYHAALGVQVVLEDYVHNKKTLLTLLYLLKIAMIVLIMLSIYSVLKILFG